MAPDICREGGFGRDRAGSGDGAGEQTDAHARTRTRRSHTRTHIHTRTYVEEEAHHREERRFDAKAIKELLHERGDLIVDALLLDASGVHEGHR